MSVKFAGNIREGDTILWDGKPATVTTAEHFEERGQKKVEVIVQSADAIAASVWDAGDFVIMA